MVLIYPALYRSKKVADKLSTQILERKALELKVPGHIKLAKYVLTLEYTLNLLQQKVDRLTSNKE